MKRSLILLTLMGLVAVGCEPTDTTAPATEEVEGLLTAAMDVTASVRAAGDAMNTRLEAEGSALRVHTAEMLAGPGSQNMGQTVFFANVGNKQLGHDFVPGDPRRAQWSGAGTDITWINDLVDGAAAGGLSPAQTAAAIRSAMGTWDGVTCSTIPLRDLGDVNVDIGFVEALFGGGSLPFPVADVMHSGFGTNIDLLVPVGVIGITFTLIWVDPGTGIPTDVDANGKLDAAFRDIYYTNTFAWSIDAGLDVETVALHEAGHGLSQAHFGSLFQTAANGRFHFAPYAVMNAGYTMVRQDITATDEAGHCSNWGEWPQR